MASNGPPDPLDVALQSVWADYLVGRDAPYKPLPPGMLKNKREALDRLLCVRDPEPFELGVLDQIETALRSDDRDFVPIEDVPAYLVASSAPATPTTATTAAVATTTTTPPPAPDADAPPLPSTPPPPPPPPASWSPAHSISVYRGDLSLLSGEVYIVNPANTTMLGCSIPSHKCLDNIIHSRAGPVVRLECAALLESWGLDGIGMETADPMITSGGVLPIKGIVHVAGPAVGGSRAPSERERDQLYATYLNSLNKAADDGATAVAFPGISTGVFAFPVPLAACIAVSATNHFFLTHPAGPAMRVIFVLWTDLDERSYAGALRIEYPHLGRVPVFRPIPERAVRWVKEAKVVIVHAGAGLSVDAVGEAGLPLDYTSEAVFGALYPGLKGEGLKRLYDTMDHRWSDPLVKWGFIFQHIHNTLTWGRHTRAYADLAGVIGRRPHTILTTNTDSLFLTSGFDPAHTYTSHGSGVLFQCAKPCSTSDNHTDVVVVDAYPFAERALPYLGDMRDPRVPDELASELIPTCSRCGGDVCLNVRDADGFLHAPYRAARDGYYSDVYAFLDDAKSVREASGDEAAAGMIVVLEVGVGLSNVPGGVRARSEELASKFGYTVRLVRVNPWAAEFEGDLPEEVAVGVPVTAAEFFAKVRRR